MAQHTPLWSQTYSVTSLADDGTPGTFRYGLQQANAGNYNAITFTIPGTVTLVSFLPPITTSSLMITGFPNTIDGNGNVQAFVIGGTSTESPSVTITNLNVHSSKALAGSGGDSPGDGSINAGSAGSGAGGGGIGAGGAFFVKGSLTYNTGSISSTTAQGGDGGWIGSGDCYGAGGGGGASFSSASIITGQDGIENPCAVCRGVPSGGDGGGDYIGYGGNACNCIEFQGHIICNPSNGSPATGLGSGGGGAGFCGGVSNTCAACVAQGGDGGFGGGGGGGGGVSQKGSSPNCPGGAPGMGGYGGGDGGYGGGIHGSGAPTRPYAGNGGDGIGGCFFVYLSSTLTLNGATCTDGTLTAGTGGFGQGYAGLSGVGFAPGVFLSTNAGLTLQGSMSAGFHIDADNTQSSDAGVTVASGIVTFPNLSSPINSYLGGTFFNGGITQVYQDSNLGASSGGLTFNGGTLEITNSFSSSRNITMGSSGGTISVDMGQLFTWQGVFISTETQGSLTKTGPGTLNFSGNTALGYTQPIYINEGVLQAGTSSSLPSFSQYVLAAGSTLDLNSQNNSIGSLEGQGTVLMSGPLTLGLDNTPTTTFAGTLNGSSALTKTGSGIFILSGNNSIAYTGSITVSEGTLQAGSTTAFGSTSAIAVPIGAALNFSSYANTMGALTNLGTVSSSATVSATSYTQTGNLSTLTLDIASSDASTLGQIFTTSAIALPSPAAGTLAGTLNVTNSGGYTPLAGDTLILLQSSGSGTPLTGKFGTVSAPSFTNFYTNYTSDSIYLSFPTCSGTWISNASSSWGITSNWDGLCAPGVGASPSANETATFSTVSNSAIIVTLADSTGASPQSVLLNEIVFNTASTSYTINQYLSAGIITLNGTGPAPPQIVLDAGSHTINAPITLGTNAEVSLDGGSTLNLAGAIGGAFFLRVYERGADTGTLILGGANTYSGGTFLAGGTLQIRESGNLGSGTLTLEGGTLQAGRPFTLSTPVSFLTSANTINTNGHAVALTLSGSGGITKTGANTLTLSGTNTYSGSTLVLVSEGTLQAGSTSAFGSNATLTVESGGTLSFATFANTTGALTNSGTVASSATVTSPTYTHNENAVLTLTIPGPTASPLGNIMTAGAIALPTSSGGSLNVINADGYTPSGGDILTLLTSSGSGKQRTGKFSSVTTPFTNAHPHYTHHSVYLAFPTCDGTWKSAASGNWGVSSNWNPSTCAPGVEASVSDNDTATFPNKSTTPITVTLSNGTAHISVLLNEMTFNALNTNYTIAQSDSAGTITLNGTGSPQIVVTAGSHTIDVPITLGENGGVSLDSDVALSITKAIGESPGPYSLTVYGEDPANIGTLTLSGTNGYSGGTAIQGCAVSVSQDPNLGNASGSITFFDGGTLIATDTFTSNRTITLNTGGGVIQVATNKQLTLGGAIGGAGLLQMEGPGTLVLSGASNYSGGTLFSLGTLNIGASNSIGTGAFTLENGTLQASASFTLTNSVIFNTSGNASIDTNGFNLNISGALSGAGDISKISNGILTLSGNNSSIGTTLFAVDQGTLQAGATTAFGNNAAITVEATGTLVFSTFANTTGALINKGLTTSSATVSAARYKHDTGATLTLTTSPLGKIAASSAISLPSPSGGTLNVTGSAPAAGTKLILLQSTGLGKQLSGTFASKTIPAGSALHYNYQTNTVSLSSPNCDGTWISTSSSNWGNTANWNNGCAPGVGAVAADNEIATFADVDASAVTATLANTLGTAAVPVVLDELKFTAAATSFTLAQYNTTSTITMNGTGSEPPQIFLEQGTHTINAPIVLGTNTGLSLGGGGTLSLGSNTTVTGPYTLTIYEGSTSGSLQLLDGAMIDPTNVSIQGGAITIAEGGALAAMQTLTVQGVQGNSSTLTVTNNGTMASGTAATFTVGGGSGGTTLTNNNLLRARGILSVGGGADSTTLINGESGTIAVSQYTQNSPSTLQVDVAAVDRFGYMTAQTATLGGNITVNALPGFAITEDLITLITADYGSSRFSSESFNFPSSVIPTLIYAPNEVQLDIRPTIRSHSGGSTMALFTSVNQHNIRILRKCVQMRDRIPQWRQDSLQAASSDVMFICADSAIQRRPEILTEKIMEPVQAAERPESIYVGPLASCGHVKTKDDQAGFGYSSIGALAGLDYAFPVEDDSYNLGLGGVIDYRCIWGETQDDLTRFTMQHLHASLYSTLIFKSIPALSYDGIVGVGCGWDTIRRRAGLGYRETAIGRPQSTMFDLFLDVEYEFSQKSYPSMPQNLRVIPLAYMQYLYDSIDGYTESGAGRHDLMVSGQTPQSLVSFLGARANYLFARDAYTLRVELDGGWQREYLNGNRSISFTAFHVANQSTSATAFGPGRNSLLLGLDLLATISVFQIEGSVDLTYNSLFYDLSFYLGVGGNF